MCRGTLHAYPGSGEDREGCVATVPAQGGGSGSKRGRSQFGGLCGCGMRRRTCRLRSLRNPHCDPQPDDLAAKTTRRRREVGLRGMNMRRADHHVRVSAGLRRRCRRASCARTEWRRASTNALATHGSLLPRPSGLCASQGTVN